MGDWSFSKNWLVNESYRSGIVEPIIAAQFKTNFARGGEAGFLPACFLIKTLGASAGRGAEPKAFHVLLGETPVEHKFLQSSPNALIFKAGQHEQGPNVPLRQINDGESDQRILLETDPAFAAVFQHFRVIFFGDEVWVRERIFPNGHPDLVHCGDVFGAGFCKFHLQKFFSYKRTKA